VALLFSVPRVSRHNGQTLRVFMNFETMKITYGYSFDFISEF
jgi:hypothetical protein